MILEGLMTTRNADGTANISPMGPIVDAAAASGAPLSRIVLRPFRTSTTYTNLKRTGEGVFHVTDDVGMIARGAIGPLVPLPELFDIEPVDVPVIRGACRWYAVRVESLDDSQDRTHIVADVVAEARLRDYFGLNRAKHAVIEAAILATRIHLTGGEQAMREYDALQVLVDKTGGESEREAFGLLRSFVQSKIDVPS